MALPRPIHLPAHPAELDQPALLPLPEGLNLMGARLAVTAGPASERLSQPLLPVTAELSHTEAGAQLAVTLLQRPAPAIITAAVLGAGEDEVRALFQLGGEAGLSAAAAHGMTCQPTALPESEAPRPVEAAPDVSAPPTVATIVDQYGQWLNQAEEDLRERRRQWETIQQLADALTRPLPPPPPLGARRLCAEPTPSPWPTLTHGQPMEMSWSGQLTWHDAEGLTANLQRALRFPNAA